MGSPPKQSAVQARLWISGWCISVKSVPAMLALPELGSAAVLSVSDLLREARAVLENRLPLAWVGGELSNFTRAPSGHCYFTLKDDRAQVDCIMYRSRAAAIDWEMKNGMRVEARALATLYEPRGRFQLQVESLRRAGPGPLYERFIRLKEQLAREGLFDPARKRPIARHPSAIGVVTSPSAAALQDVVSTLARRNPSIPVIVYPTAVQGEGAAERIAAALVTANRRAECQVLLLVRGGGSLEDLWQFNEERVARAIRDSRIPVIVGVGHETDFTIADFAADLRAPTPTAAAELCSASRADVLAQLRDLLRAASREMKRQFDYAAQAVDHLTRRLAHPADRLHHAERLLGQLRVRLASSASRPFDALGYRVAGATARLSTSMTHRLSLSGSRLEHARGTLGGLDPSAVLARGYSITRDAQGRVVSDPIQVRPGDRLHTILARGSIESEVKHRL